MLKSQDILPLVILLQHHRYVFVSQFAFAQKLGWAPSSLHRSLERLTKCGLWYPSQQCVNGHGVFELLRYGVRYVFPPVLMAPCRGVVTGCLPEIAQPELPYVWPSEQGGHFGVGVQPLDKSFPKVAMENPDLSQGLHLVEAFRLGRKREVVIATKLLQELLAEGERH